MPIRIVLSPQPLTITSLIIKSQHCKLLFQHIEVFKRKEQMWVLLLKKVHSTNMVTLNKKTYCPLSYS